MASSTGTISKRYAKRPGTSGVRGHLYESKLLSLIYFRAIHDDEIEDFHLATNVDKLGSFDDICFRAEVKEFNEPIAVFIQAKHRENDSVLTLNSKSDLLKHFKSYLEIRRKFKPNNDDVLFEGTFSETKCFFVIYTTANGDKETKRYKGRFATYLNALIGTGDPGSQPSHDTKDVELLCKIVLEDQMTALARLMAKCIYEENTYSQELMKDALVIRYHVILAQKVFDISEDESDGHHIACFKEDFFDTNEALLQLFKDELCSEISKNKKFEYLVNPFSTETVYEKFGNGIIYNKNGLFEFVDKTSSNFEKLFLDEINKSQETTRRTLELTLKEYLSSLKFIVPASFGNKDLTIKGGEKKIERKLKHLTSQIVGLIKQSQLSYIITVDNSMGEGFLQLSGGIASAVGNLLVSDHTSPLMKFNANYESLGKLAKRLFDQLKSEISNLYDYKFDFKVEIFPILSFTFDEYTNNYVKDFLSSLLFYTSQSNENGVQKALIYEINQSQCDADDAQNVEMTSDAIFLKYHDEVQKWWMTADVYLTKDGKLYENAVKHARNQSLIGVLKMMQAIKNKNYTFSDAAMNSINSDELPSGTIIVSENNVFTVAKLTQRFNNKHCFMLDLEYILNLSPRNDKLLCKELMNTSEVKIIIVVIDKSPITTTTSIKLENIANSIKHKRVIIISDPNYVEIAKKYFTKIDNVIEDERNNLVDLSEHSQNYILNHTTVVVQGHEVTLAQVLYHASIGCVGAKLLYEIMHSKTYLVGKPVSTLNYTSSLYIQRSVTYVTLSYPKSTETINEKRVEAGHRTHISTIYDITDDAVLIIGDPGMGKSTLLTHLSLKTKELHPSVWILRINLIEYSRQFSEWQIHETAIDTFESLKFMCQVALSEESSKKGDVEITLEESNGTVLLENCTGDAWTVFELKIFLHYYNTKKLIILFDGFDEICPNYAPEVLSLMTVVKNWPQKHTMWISSRSYNIIESVLVLDLSIYRIEPLNNNQQREFSTKFWDDKELLVDLNAEQFQNIYDFSMFMSKSDDLNMIMKKKDLPNQSNKEMPFLAIYLHLVKYLMTELDDNCFFYRRKHSNTRRNRLNRFRDSYDRHDEDDFVSLELYSSTLVALNSVSNNISEYTQNFFTTPLHLKMVANYLFNQIRNTRKNSSKWDLNTNFFNIYESFVETKMKKIRFQEKTQNDIFRPDNITVYKQMYADSIEKHKKLAAYAVYGECLFDEDELKQLKEKINNVKEGEERTGIICNVVDDIPIFVHSTVAEYCAVEYICDLIKKNEKQKYSSLLRKLLRQENLKSIWDFILNVMFVHTNTNVLALLDAKMKIDEELTAVIALNNKTIFDLLLEQSKKTKKEYGEIKSSLCEAVRRNLRNLGVQLLSTIDHNLNDSNLMDFIEIVKETNMLLVAVKMDFEEIVVTIIQRVKIVNPSKLSALFDNIEKFEVNGNIDEVNNDEILQALHRVVWKRINVVPVWENLVELSGQICFI